MAPALPLGEAGVGRKRDGGALLTPQAVLPKVN
jgi:hypothetical protein